MDLQKATLLQFRAQLEKSFSSDTAVNTFESAVPSAGHCAVAAVILWKTVGDALVSANVNESSHWFNRIQINNQLFDCDVTGDQFGFPTVQIKPAEELYPCTRERSPDELSEDTLRRAVLLARRSGFLQVAEALERRRQRL